MIGRYIKFFLLFIENFIPWEIFQKERMLD